MRCAKYSQFRLSHVHHSLLQIFDDCNGRKRDLCIGYLNSIARIARRDDAFINESVSKRYYSMIVGAILFKIWITFLDPKLFHFWFSSSNTKIWIGFRFWARKLPENMWQKVCARFRFESWWWKFKNLAKNLNFGVNSKSSLWKWFAMNFRSQNS